MMTGRELRGLYVAMVTPFGPEGELNRPALRRLVDRLIEEKPAGLVPCGTTGESATLSHPEHREVVALTVEAAKGRVPVIAGAGSNSTAEALEMVRNAEKDGADGVLVVCPYYNRPTQEGLIAHFSRLAEATRLPIVIYNIPKRTGVNMEPATVARLAQQPNIIGIKEASGDASQVMDLIARVPPDFSVLSGDGYLTFSICCLGGRGAILADANVATGEWVKLVALVTEGRLAEAREQHFRLLPLARALFLETNPAPVKAALNLLGLEVGDPRLPLLPASEKCRQVLREELGRLGLAPAGTR
jgi:4-hydroxy-tetrahydrodipicolinate synthase